MLSEKIHHGNLILVNSQFPFREKKIRLSSVDSRYSNVLLDSEAAHMLGLLLSKISAKDSIIPISGYRSLEEQEAIYNNSLKDNGAIFTNKFVALPNHSEHHTGLAIDLALNKEDIDYICPEFPYTGVCDDFRRSAPDYGFIERYSKDKKKLTGISHEPWHFRYVGFPHSKIIVDKKLSLEEYIEFIKVYRNNNRFIFRQEGEKNIEIYYVPACDDDEVIAIHQKSGYKVSGNNVDGFIMTT